MNKKLVHPLDIEAKRTDKILYYHDLGLNNTEIGKLVDCSKENVRQILQRLGIYSPVCFNKHKNEEEVTA